MKITIRIYRRGQKGKDNELFKAMAIEAVDVTYRREKNMGFCLIEMEDRYYLTVQKNDAEMQLHGKKVNALNALQEWVFNGCDHPLETLTWHYHKDEFKALCKKCGQDFGGMNLL